MHAQGEPSSRTTHDEPERGGHRTRGASRDAHSFELGVRVPDGLSSLGSHRHQRLETTRMGSRRRAASSACTDDKSRQTIRVRLRRETGVAVQARGALALDEASPLAERRVAIALTSGSALSVGSALVLLIH
jgi:hypothetical protein